MRKSFIFFSVGFLALCMSCSIERRTMESNFYLQGTKTVAAIRTGETVTPTQEFQNKKELEWNGKQIVIERSEIMETKDPDFAYLVLTGVRIDRIRDGVSIDKDSARVSYKIAYPITSSKSMLGSADTHTCASSTSDYCHLCEFDRDKNGKIKGCKCSSTHGGVCLHSVTTVEDEVDPIKP